MPDIDPAALSRPSVTQTTPILKSITVSAPSAQKAGKSSHFIPARIDLEPLYGPLRSAIGGENWPTYYMTVAQFIRGQLNQTEYSERIDAILSSPNNEKLHLHNQLIAAIYGNITREMPDAGLAPWVSASDKPSTNMGAKPVTGDAAERRLKGEVMQLPSRDRRRIKDLAQNDFDPYDSMASLFSDHHRSKISRVPDSAPSASGLSKMNFDLEIRKRFAQPLAVESGEYPDVASIESRMLPICYEQGLANGHAPDAAQYMMVATDAFLKEFLTSVFSRTRSNGPGESATAGFGAAIPWVQTHKYRKQLGREEAAFARGELTRDKSGLLPVEAKAASDRPPLDMADLRLALDLGDCGLGSFTTITKSVVYNYREGELENWDNYTYLPGRKPTVPDDMDLDAVNGTMTNGVHQTDCMEIDSEPTWEGADAQAMSALDSVLDSCLATGP